MEKRKQFIDKTKNLLILPEIVEEKPKGGGGKRGRVSFEGVLFVREVNFIENAIWNMWVLKRRFFHVVDSEKVYL